MSNLMMELAMMDKKDYYKEFIEKRCNKSYIWL